MKQDYRQIEANTPFEESIIWQINRSYYEEAGLSAWSNGVVPHNLTSNASVGKTYAALILGFLKDITAKECSNEVVYIIELGSGHGRLAYHILRQLDKMIALEKMKLPNYCYVLTDIVESNLSFFEQHPQLQGYFDSGRLDVAYFDGVQSQELPLRKKGFIIKHHSLNTPIIAIANYFFDSLPNQLYAIKEGKAHASGLTIDSFELEGEVSNAVLLKNLKTTIHVSTDAYVNEESPFITDLLNEYCSALKESYVLIPRLAMQCIDTLRGLSKQGLMLISMDKGYADIKDLEARPIPEIIRHGSFSLYVNFHALEKYCYSTGGKTIFSSFSDYSMQLGCFLFVNNAEDYTATKEAYEHYINDFGPDDYNGIKKMVYRLVKQLSLRELITVIRLGYYDSTLFLKLLPFVRLQLKTLNNVDRRRLSQTLTKVNQNFFDINETPNVSFEIAGLFYDLAYYQESLDIYNKQIDHFGQTADVYYNKALCYYQLRMDKEFSAIVIEAKKAYPAFDKYVHLDKLDLGAA